LWHVNFEVDVDSKLLRLRWEADEMLLPGMNHDFKGEEFVVPSAEVVDSKYESMIGAAKIKPIGSLKNVAQFIENKYLIKNFQTGSTTSSEQ
jgi:hypothetical protein